MNQFLSCSLFVSLSAVSAQAIIIIDNFETVQNISVTSQGGSSIAVGETFANTNTALGVERDILLTKTFGDNGDEARIRVNPNGQQRLSFSNEDGVNSIAQIVYDGIDGSSAIAASGLGGIDASSENALRLIVATSDIGGPVTFSITDSDSASSAIATALIPGGVNSVTGPQSILIPFSSFVASSNTGQTVDDVFDSIGSINFSIDASAVAQQSWDSRYSQLAFVPEASQFSMFAALAALGFCLVRRRK